MADELRMFLAQWLAVGSILLFGWLTTATRGR